MSTKTEPIPSASRITGNSDMSRLIRDFKWQKHPLGPISGWPESLITAVNMILCSPVPQVLLWSADGLMIFNDAFAAFAGPSHPQLLGRPVTEAWKDIAKFHEHVIETCLKGEQLQYSRQKMTIIRGKKPSEAWLDLTYSPVITESGKPGGVLAVVVDVTQLMRAEQKKKEAEAKLEHERKRLQSIFMQAPTSIAILTGPEFVISMANEPYKKLVGRKAIIGKPLDKALPELVTQSFMDLLRQVYETGETHSSNEVPFTVKEGRTKASNRFLNFTYQPFKDEDGSLGGILVHAVDVTDQVIARQQVEDIANLNKTITDNATTGMMIMDADHYCTYMNPAAEQITGYTLEQIRRSRKTLHDIVHPLYADGSPYPIEDCPTSKALVDRKRVLSEDFFIRPDGSRYPVAIMTTPIIRDGEMVGIVEEIRDITAEKRAERRILELNKDLEERVVARTAELTAANKELGRSNEELQDFAYVASHDLQEPLRKIAAFANLLDEDFGQLLPAEAHHYLDGMRSSSARMRTLINDLLTYSRVTTQARPFETVDLGKLARESLEDLQTRIEETGAHITVGELGRIKGDPLQLRLLFQNLISNAMKYAKTDVPPIISVTAIVKDNCRILSITDNGIGFDPRYTDRIFTIFQRLHGKNEYEGTGVGLAIVKKIVERHGGTIKAESTPDVGSTFIISLPISREFRNEKGVLMQ